MRKGPSQLRHKYIPKEEASVRTAETKALYTARKDPEIVQIPEGNFLTFNGQGSPESVGLQQAVGALFAVAYGLR
jgi:hypothetical protein